MCGQCGPMPAGTLLVVAVVFALAGFVKGVIGLGLPTISMGPLAIVMPPVEAAAILILPSFITNVWQMLVGPSLRDVFRRLNDPGLVHRDVDRYGPHDRRKRTPRHRIFGHCSCPLCRHGFRE